MYQVSPWAPWTQLWEQIKKRKERKCKRIALFTPKASQGCAQSCAAIVNLSLLLHSSRVNRTSRTIALCQFQFAQTWETKTGNSIVWWPSKKVKGVTVSSVCLKALAECQPSVSLSVTLPSLPLEKENSSRPVQSQRVYKAGQLLFAHGDIDATKPINVGNILGSSGALRTFSFCFIVSFYRNSPEHD